MSKTLFDFTVKTITNKEWNLNDCKGKVVLIVNVASKCGFTPQYKELEELYQKHKDNGFMIIGVPCNQFANQEPGSSEDIQNFCSLNYNVTFPLTEKMVVNGSGNNKTAPLYEFLKESRPGIMGLKAIKWNFEKFLVDREGKVQKRYSSLTAPKGIEPDVLELLSKGNSDATASDPSQAQL